MAQYRITLNNEPHTYVTLDDEDDFTLSIIQDLSEDIIIERIVEDD